MIVSNTTPLINFAAIHRLDILEHLFGHIVIPQAVHHELLEKGKFYPSTAAIQRATFIETRPIQNISLYKSLQEDLNEGEAAAIVLALEVNAALLLIDEVEGRKVAEAHQIPFTGSIGCLAQAKKAGLISAIRPLLNAMQTNARFWIHPKLYATILQEQGE